MFTKSTGTALNTARVPFASYLNTIHGRIHPIFADDFLYLKSVAKATPKLTIPSPSMMNYRSGRAAIDPAVVTADGAFVKAATAGDAKGVDALYHDLDERPGSKFATADLIGVPYQVVIGPKGLAAGQYEVKKRADGRYEAK